MEKQVQNAEPQNYFTELEIAVYRFEDKVAACDLHDPMNFIKLEEEYFFMVDVLRDFEKVGFAVEGLKESLAHTFWILHDIHDILFPINSEVEETVNSNT